jgi:acyl phosphate:glycerol-3-phosphate acyltransferase
MFYVIIVFLIIAAYLIGSIPTAVWVGKIFYKIDVREHGSKNAGTTNTIRVLGVVAGVPVFVIDIMKGFAAAMLVNFSGLEQHTNLWISFQIFLGAAAVVGHILPIFASFNGGKGVATILGASFALHPLAAFCCFVIFMIIAFSTRFVSLASIISSCCYPLLMIFVFRERFISLVIYSIILSVVILIVHQKNIIRLYKGEESKFYFRKSVAEMKNKEREMNRMAK